MASTVWRGYITFGLISIPVRLFRAARAERVSFRRLHREDSSRQPPRQAIEGPEVTTMGTRLSESRPITSGNEAPPPAWEGRRPILSPVQQVSVRRGTDEVLEHGSVVKGYEYDKNRFVVVEPEELKSAASKTSTQMEIGEFVQLSEIDPVYFETSYYVAPEEAGEKAYALLYQALQRTGLVAVARFAMHSREHVVVLRPGKTGIIAHTMFFSSEVRADEEYRADTSAVAPKELDLAQTLIHSLAGPFEPEKYRDTYRERLESIIARKVRGEPVSSAGAIQKPAEVVDIADALRRSLANLKKPVASEEQARTPERATSRTKKTSRGAGQK
ncbi:MAG: Ku protein [Acidobacteriaceae bacterium]|nr:Ku protein [Acidobacteriaceae bacterium]